MTSSYSFNFLHGASPEIKERKLIGYFGTDETGDYLSGMSQLKYYKPPKCNKVNFDLNKNLDKTKYKHKDSKLDLVLTWILKNINDVFVKNPDGHWIGPDFISYRGTMSQFFKVPVEASQGWIVIASKFQNTIYLCGYETEYEILLEKDERQQQCCSWGYKFEQFLLSDDPDQDPNPEQPMERERGFFCVYKSQFYEYELLYAGEMDGIQSDKKIENLTEDVEFIELKSTFKVTNKFKEESLWKFKFPKWWCQSYLVGINSIICGFRNETGIIEELKEYKLPEIIRCGLVILFVHYYHKRK